MEIEKFFVSFLRDGENCLRGRESEGNARRTQIDIDEWELFLLFTFNAGDCSSLISAVAPKCDSMITVA